MEGDAAAVLEATAALVDHNLIRREADANGERELRFGMLETIREYARGRLIASGHAEAVARAHGMYYLGFIEQFRPALSSEWWPVGWSVADALALIDRDHDNVRTALAWAVGTGEAEVAVRLARGTKMYWQMRGHLSEGRRWFTAALAEGGHVQPLMRAGALDQASWLINMQGDYAAARALAEEGLTIARALGHRQLIASLLYTIAMNAQAQSDYATARTLHEESLIIDRELGETLRIAFILSNLAELARLRGDYADAEALLEEALQLERNIGSPQAITYALNDLGVLARDTGDSIAARTHLMEAIAIRRDLALHHALAQSLDSLGMVERDEGRYTAARALHEEALTLLQAQGDRQGSARALLNLATVAHRTGDDATAQAQCRESLRMARDLGDKNRIAECLRLLAEIAGRQGEPLHAARLWAAADALRMAIDVRLPPVDRAYEARVISAAQAGYGQSGWEAAWEEGRQMDLSQVISLALHEGRGA
jgi:tetratricopeptide (TPR) repeat protein